MPNQLKSKKSKPLTPEEYEEMILEYVKQFPSGLTITDISKGIGISRITVNKYILVLEAREKLFSKSIGAYKLYLVQERAFLPKSTIASFYQGLLSGFISELADKKEKVFKKIGFNMDKFITFPVGSGIPKDILKPEKGSYKKLLNYYAEFYNTMDYIIDKNTEIEVNINAKGNKAIYILKNIKPLEENEDFAMHFYIITGMIEKTLPLLIQRKVICNIEKIYDNNLEFSIEIF